MSEENNMQAETFINLDSFKNHTPQLKDEQFFVEELGGSIGIKEMNLADRDAYQSQLTDVSEIVKDSKGKIIKVKAEGQLALLLFHTLIYIETGEYIFNNYEQAKKQLNKLKPTTIDAIAEVAADLNGLSPEAVEDAEGESEDLNDSSTINSQENED